MITANCADALSYRGIHPRLDAALEKLTESFLAAVPREGIELEGKALRCFSVEYDTLPLSETFFESHQRYLDIQLVLEGEERVDLARRDTLEAYESGDDIELLRGEAEQSVILRRGGFLAVFPGEAHRLKIQTDGPRHVKKVVFKVLLNEDR